MEQRYLLVCHVSSWEDASNLRACHTFKPVKMDLRGKMTLRKPMWENLIVGITAYVVSFVITPTKSRGQKRSGGGLG